MYRINGTTNIVLSLGLALPALALSGCGGATGNPNRPATVPVEGTITMDGEPVADAIVTFAPATQARPGQAAPGRAAAGRTDETGHYTLTTFEEGDGAVPGEYHVTVLKREDVEVKDVSMEELMNRGGPSNQPANRAANAGLELLVPKKYTNRQTTPFHVTVEQSGNEPFDFKLTGGAS